ncbi:MAG TPA: hypothetical protein VJ984_09700 [Xanthomonadales bacterium]|nr:hypothetical protein [Xanthomonadales bacterium]
MNTPETNNEIKMDSSDLYREVMFTDNRIGTIRQMQPVTADGDDDSGRPSRFFGSAQLMTPAGPLPVSFEIEADSLAKAVEGFGPAAQGAIEKTLEELKELQREQASSIVVPKGNVDPSALGGGGIQMP